MLRIKLASVCLLFVGLTATGHANEMLNFNEAAFQRAMQSGAPILVETYSAGCPTCWIQEATIREAIEKPEFAALQVFVVDANGDAAPKRMLNAPMKSTLIVFRNGSEAGRLIGVTQSAGIEKLLRKVISQREP